MHCDTLIAVSPVRRASFLLYASIQFVVLTLCAIVAYPGGALFDPTTKHYGFFLNFFSDLGTTRAYSGRPNTLSCVMFVIALTTIGVAIIAFAGAWRAFAFGKRRGLWLGIGSQLFGITSGLGFIGVAVTPWNLVLEIHNTFVLTAFSLLLGYVGCLTILMWMNEAKRALITAHVAYLAVLFSYVCLLFFGPDLLTEHGHFVQVTGQKIIVYTSMLNLMFQAYSTRRLLSS